MVVVRNLKIIGLTKICITAIIFTLSVGCSVIENSHRQKMPMMSAFAAGNNEIATDEIRQRLQSPSVFNNSVVNSGDELVWRLEAGSLNFHLGNFTKSLEELSAAENLINDYDERAIISLRDVSASAASLITNPNSIPYRGFDRDRIMVSFYKSLAYLGCGREDSFRAQLHRLRNEQKKISLDYQKFFDREKEKYKEAENNNPEALSLFEKGNTIEKLLASDKNQAFADTIKKLAVKQIPDMQNFSIRRHCGCQASVLCRLSNRFSVLTDNSRTGKFPAIVWQD